jgi:HSP20 family protein
MSFLNTLIPTLGRAGTCANGECGEARRPRYEINETEAGYTLAAFLPGVSKEGLEITDEGGELKIAGKRAVKLPEGQAAVYRETSDASFELVLQHDNAIDPEKTVAELKDGVLRLTLAKAESAKPRKISVS